MPHRSWTDEQLELALPTSRTWAEVLRRLGVDPRSGGSLAAARRRSAELDLATGHLPGREGAGPRRWTEDDLRRVVPEVTSLAGVFRALDLSVGGGAWRRMAEHIVRLELSTEHFGRGPLGSGAAAGPTTAAWDDDGLRDALEASTSISEVMRRLGLSVNAHGQRRRIHERIEELGLATEYLRGRGASGGRPGGPPRRPLEEVLVADRPTRTSALRERLIQEGILPARCERCQLDTWLEGPIPLQLDHVNGQRDDNRLENLRLLCPTCHALTGTYCGRNVARR